MANRVSTNRRRVGKTARKAEAGLKRRQKDNKRSSTLRSRKHRLHSTPDQVLVNNIVRKWHEAPECASWLQRMKTAARARGARPLTHNLYDLRPGEKVQVLTDVFGKAREGVWNESVIVACRQLRSDHPKAILRKFVQEGEVGTIPSSVVVIDKLFGEKERNHGLKKSCSYLQAVHDWQVVPLRFWKKGGKKGARAVLWARQCRRRKEGKGGLLDVNKKPATMLTKSSGKKVQTVKVRGLRRKKNEVRFQ